MEPARTTGKVILSDIVRKTLARPFSDIVRTLYNSMSAGSMLL